MNGKNDAAEYPFNETVNSQWWLITEVALGVVVAAVAVTLAMMLSGNLSPAPTQTVAVAITAVAAIYAAAVGSLRARTMWQLWLRSRRNKDRTLTP